jgi:16S rRNA processing protein RimM
VLKFRGVDSIDDAELLVGSEIQIPASERSPLEPGAAYVSELVGCALLATEGENPEREVGIVADVQFGAGVAPLLIVRDGKREYMVPFAEAYLKQMDLEHKRILMALPEGMLQLDAPLSHEEKHEQTGPK